MGVIFGLIDMLLLLFELLILARVLMSWFPVDRGNQFVRMIYDVTEPVLAPVRQALPPMSGIDFSPLVVLLVIQVLRVIF